LSVDGDAILKFSDDIAKWQDPKTLQERVRTFKEENGVSRKDLACVPALNSWEEAYCASRFAATVKAKNVRHICKNGKVDFEVEWPSGKRRFLEITSADAPDRRPGLGDSNFKYDEGLDCNMLNEHYLCTNNAKEAVSVAVSKKSQKNYPDNTILLIYLIGFWPHPEEEIWANALTEGCSDGRGKFVGIYILNGGHLYQISRGIELNWKKIDVVTN